MSEEAVIDPPETWTAAAMPLLREYVDKLQHARDQLRVLKELKYKMAYANDTEHIVDAEFGVIQELLKRLKPAALDLSRQVSGMIDQGRVTPLERVEMKLRLAEFESLLNQLPQLLVAYRR